MRAFACDVCGNLLVFENSMCVSCGTLVGYCVAEGRLVPLGSGPGWQPCANQGIAGCTWVVEPGGGLCLSCRLTRTRPRDDDSAGLAAFALTERAKRRLVYQLLDLGLPVCPRPASPGAVAGAGQPALVFDLLSSAGRSVVTGHADGVITIDLAEGEDAHREAMRVQMGEPYRTLLGHLRHECGHYYWQRLVAPADESGGFLEQSRRLFGDERADYASALERHYARGAGAQPGQGHVSAYAAAHPWEDWAETFAHYLHIRDTLQTASAYGMVVAGPDVAPVQAQFHAIPHEATSVGDDIGEIISTWLPLSYALNAVNRSMGKDDLYPFVLTPAVIDKLGLVHAVVRAAGASCAEAASTASASSCAAG